jgi:hypothetical protein
LASIFEPQVVSQPSAQKMSFWAIGIPVSGPASRRARRAADARLGQRALRVHRDVGIEPAVALDALEIGAGQLDARKLPFTQVPRELGHGPVGHG